MSDTHCIGYLSLAHRIAFFVVYFIPVVKRPLLIVKLWTERNRGSGYHPLQETTLHATLKNHYTLAGGAQEIKVDGYWIDVVHGDELIEIQTGNFTALRGKLLTLIDRYRVRLVHPIALEKWIVRLPGKAELTDRTKLLVSRRRSPRRGRFEDIFRELVYIADLFPHPKLNLELLLIQVEEIRRDDGLGSWRRGGVSIIDRKLISIVERRTLSTINDWGAFLPPGLPAGFTNQQLQQTLGISARLANQMTYCLRKIGIINLSGKHSRSHVFTRTT